MSRRASPILRFMPLRANGFYRNSGRSIPCMQCWNVELHSTKVQLDESGLPFCNMLPCTFFYREREDRTGHYNLLPRNPAQPNLHGLGGQLLVVRLHTSPRSRSPEFLVIETPALEGAAAEYRGMRVFARSHHTRRLALTHRRSIRQRRPSSLCWRQKKGLTGTRNPLLGEKTGSWQT